MTNETQLVSREEIESIRAEHAKVDMALVDLYSAPGNALSMAVPARLTKSVDTLLRYIDQQAERITVIEQKDRIKTVEYNVLVKENRELAARIAQLQSVPEERREIAERQHTRWEIEREHGQMFGSAMADIGTLLQDAARYRNAHDVLVAERNDAIAKRLATFERAAGLEKRIEQLETALQTAFNHLDMEGLSISHCKDHALIVGALAAADGQKLQEFRERTIDELQRFKVPTDPAQSAAYAVCKGEKL